MSKIDESKLRTGLKDPSAPLVVPTPDEPQPDEQSLGYGAVTLPTGHRDFLWKVHSYTNDYIRFSDAKSGVVIGFAVATLGALYATGAFATIRATTPGDWSALDQTLLAAVAFLVAGALAAAWSMRPRLDDKQRAASSSGRASARTTPPRSSISRIRVSRRPTSTRTWLSIFTRCPRSPVRSSIGVLWAYYAAWREGCSQAYAFWSGNPAFWQAIAAVAVDIRLARYARGHHLSRAAESQRRLGIIGDAKRRLLKR